MQPDVDFNPKMKSANHVQSHAQSDVFAEAHFRGLIAERADIPNRFVALPAPVEEPEASSHRPSTREIIAWARADAHRRPLWDDLTPHGAPRAAVQPAPDAPARSLAFAVAGPLAFGLIGLATMAFVAVG